MADAQILRAARARIADPIHWTQHHLTRDERGRVVSPRAHEAVCWCAYGALAAEGPGLQSSEAYALQSAARALTGNGSAAYVNDMLGHAAVLAIYDTAIASAEVDAGAESQGGIA